ncbi:large multi-functional protein [Rhodopirellula maiorica SM1]|uniref:Large multi-functional protein n=2 Tax=Novipirellula TaxID=2795426 RepID=M5S2K2_9BACT|nr:large multi-functional protein [Rhodopirellula maiorica SM1]
MVVVAIATGSLARADAPPNTGTSGSNREQKELDAPASTLGLAPPTEAVVLFDGSNFDAWKPFSFQWINPKDDQKQIQWKLVDDDAMEIAFEFEGKRRKQFLCTKEKFGDYRLHLEFQLPKEGSGNSGIFFGPLYELQIFDSADKNIPGMGDCGAIYQIRAPDSNAALEPGVWQTIDLEFQAADIGANGFMTENGAARVTIRLNGQLIHDDVRLSLRRNKYAAFPEERMSPIVLQEHGSNVKFRNIWLVEKAANSNAKLKK